MTNQIALEDTDKVRPLIEWLGDRWSFRDASVLELGAYNGRNTWQMAVAGADVIAIEPRAQNVEAWTSHVKPLDRLVRHQPTIMQGTLEDCQGAPQTDLIFHCGVLYHLQDPLAHLHRLPAYSPRMYLNTHITPDDQVDGSLSGYEGRHYSEPTNNNRAGLEARSFWFTRSALFDVLAAAGYSSPQVVTEKTETNGPRIGLWCEVSK